MESISADNQAAMLRAYNENHNSKSRQIHLKHDHVRDLITEGSLTVQFIKSSIGKEMPFATSREMGLKIYN